MEIKELIPGARVKLGEYIKIIQILNFREYKYESDILEKTRINGGMIDFYLSRLIDLGYIEDEEDERDEKSSTPRYKYKLTEKGINCRTEWEKKLASSSCMDVLLESN